MNRRVDTLMRLRVFKNMIKQGFQGMWRNRSMGLASISSISAVLVILGLVLILILSINNAVLETKTKFDEIQVFLEDDLEEEELDNLEGEIAAEEGVLSVIYYSRERGLEVMKEDWGEDSTLLEGLEDDNPLQDSYKIQLRDIKYADEVVDNIRKLEGVESINYYKDVIDKLMAFSRYIQIGGAIIVGMLVLVSIFIIANTIKITVAARQREIGIMKYVGATNGYIRGPFIIEGILFGLVGALISILIINYGYEYFFTSVNEKFFEMFTVYLVPPSMLIKDISIIFASIGIGIGSLGSIISLKRYLNV